MKAWDRLISVLKRLPGVGPRQAERLALHLMRTSADETEALLAAVREAKARIRPCSRCFDYTDAELCRICSDPARDQSIICVVEEPQDVDAVERTGNFKGLYHVLHGAISPTEGITPGAIKLKELTDRVKASNGAVKELIIATNPDTEGEAMAIYLTRLLSKYVPKITRIAYGVPLGGDIDYLDEITLGYALKGRVEI